MSRANWIVIGKWTAAVAVISGAVVYAVAFLNHLPLAWAAIVHVSVTAIYFGSVASFGVGDVLEAAPLAVVLTVLACVAMPAYRDFTIRKSLAEVVFAGRDATAALDRYRAGTNSAPKSIVGLGVSMPQDKVMDVRIEAENLVTVTLSLPPVAGSELVFVAITTDGIRSWKCMARNINPSHRPPGCREEFKAPN